MVNGAYLDTCICMFTVVSFELSQPQFTLATECIYHGVAVQQYSY